MDENVEHLRVLIPTSRHIYRLVSYGMVVDFEDAVAQSSDADLVGVPIHSRRMQLEGLLRGKPTHAIIPPRDSYDICLLIAMSVDWVPSLRYLRHLREKARRVVVYLFDSWLSDLPRLRSQRKVWALVDDVFVSFAHAVQEYRDQLPCRVHYLPQAIDPRWFRPYQGHRPIHVLSMGRRLASVHKELLRISRRRDLFYMYQTHSAPRAIAFDENQELVGRLSQLSQVHVSWQVSKTNPLRAGEGTAITARWYEAAASGAVILGSAPDTPEFARLFPYRGFVHELDPDEPHTTEKALDRALSETDHDDRDALAGYVRTKHTWTRRWREIVQACSGS